MTWIAQLRAHGSSEVPPAFSDSGSKPPPMPALEQNSAIGPNCRSVSSMTWQDVLFLPDIAFERRAIDRGGDGFGAGEIEIGDHHLGRAGAMKGFAQRPADAVGAAGDDHDFAGTCIVSTPTV